MPCRDYGPEPSSNNQEAKKLKQRLNSVTKILCEASRALEARAIPLSEEHDEWWKKHKEADDAARKKEIDKLQSELNELQHRAAAKIKKLQELTTNP